MNTIMQLALATRLDRDLCCAMYIRQCGTGGMGHIGQLAKTCSKGGKICREVTSIFAGAVISYQGAD